MPKPVDTYPFIYPFIVVGAGPAGLAAAHQAAKSGSKVALIERNLLGGICLNTGCIPSKTLIRTSRLYEEMRRAEDFGATPPPQIDVDFPAAIRRVQRVRSRIARETSVEELRALGVDLFFGEASFEARDAIRVAGNVLRFKKALIATGTRPTIPSIDGLATSGYQTHETIFEL